jgi:hypothetical protein
MICGATLERGGASEESKAMLAQFRKRSVRSRIASKDDCNARCRGSGNLFVDFEETVACLGRSLYLLTGTQRECDRRVALGLWYIEVNESQIPSSG